ncbi:unnamed protein product [Sphagnum balticum]
MSMRGEERVSKEEAAGARGGESYHRCVSREAAMDACDNDFTSKRRREAQVQQGFRSDDNGAKEKTRHKPNDPRHQTHQQRRHKQHHDTAPSLTIIDTRPISNARRLFDCMG